MWWSIWLKGVERRDPGAKMCVSVAVPQPDSGADASVQLAFVVRKDLFRALLADVVRQMQASTGWADIQLWEEEIDMDQEVHVCTGIE